mmetsp:Transcript_85164/g.150673  ORF Transcript_85164/g.150673 Transcript_85164/m.150673 type:complete len:538 (-) Transcript_85164:99-1712(-)|eukprot:CAMPEP_0197663494 /NCGR_PEP_ID=MMETSP1338-20131121/57653_1 /TAXON_ID=43686 ORGANISM="Pelagodinium beii, Strain RCC1491" /NCGR_SAMPLE_ID=MMETSP1338 /ASSEMBLY_ACC=CAM_ASM_000754 /LENGTH=537 /DNA_ID=CAMNT_0043241897 /DNA_START=62 /DNA_END=1675 /DNA_ORIENTATION=-
MSEGSQDDLLRLEHGGSGSDDCSDSTVEPTSRSRVIRVAVGGAILVACGLLFLLRTPATDQSPEEANAALFIEDFDLTGMATDFCWKNKSFYVELSGQFDLPHGSHDTASSPYECQKRCAQTYLCEHFSYWQSGACLLTSYSAYQRAYTGGDSNGVISGPRTCEVFDDMPTESLYSAQNVPPFVAEEAEGCGHLHDRYQLAWAAEGETFFDDWMFLTKSETRGAEWYLNKSEAFQNGVAFTSKAGTILRVGEQVHPFKRRSVMLHSAQAFRPDKGFVLVMKYKHVPYGPGLWPAFWLVNSDLHWPDGGELDVLEYANDETAKLTFHTDKNCSINMAKVEQCDSKMRNINPANIPSCYTNYTANKNGCMPPQVRKNGEWYAKNPGAVALVWDASGVSSYHIPEAEIPLDLSYEKPTPNEWRDEWRMSYMPFEAASCVNIAKPMEIVLNIALCGDWAGNTFYDCLECRETGFVPNYCVPGHVTEPATDCCTIYMSNPSAEEPLKTKGFFDIDYVKVFTPEGMVLPKLASGTYRKEKASM